MGAYFLMLGGLACAVWRGTLVIYWFREWWHWRLKDPSIAELYQVNWWFEAVWTMIGLVVAGGGFYLVRRRK